MPETVMKPSEVRTRVLDEHVRIRALLGEAESLAEKVLNGDPASLYPLRVKMLELQQTLHAHLSFEDDCLYPAICEADAWGGIRGERMKEEHARQRLVLGQLALSEWRAEGKELVSLVRSLVKDMRQDMSREESELLNPDLLRDDVICIAQDSG